jgi:hypothetical protein
MHPMTQIDTAEHVADVLARLGRIRASLRAESEALALAVRVHDESESVKERLLCDSESAEHAHQIVRAFGEIWQCGSQEEISLYAERHAAHLWPVLVFELVHEGSATPQMLAAAQCMGFADRFMSLVIALGNAEQGTMPPNRVCP